MTSGNYDFWFFRMTSGIDESMRDIEEYLQSFNTHLTRLDEDFARRKNEFDQNSSYDEYGYYADQLIDEGQQLDFFGKILQNTTLASVVTYFELQAVKLTRTDFRIRERSKYGTKEELQNAIKQQLGRYENLREYWKRHGLNYHQSALWEEITTIGKVRNKIVHTNGELEDDGTSKDIRIYVEQRLRKGKESLKIYDNMIVVEPEFCSEAMKLYKKFLFELGHGISVMTQTLT